MFSSSARVLVALAALAVVSVPVAPAMAATAPSEPGSGSTRAFASDIGDIPLIVPSAQVTPFLNSNPIRTLLGGTGGATGNVGRSS
ncbi:hypothetical protein [Streptomyces sp. NPDC127066]|uniref:hypothetical protein n=1 Tax=Streptomyces sp. NPDC127066 TaxID=3347125 RepID=UPI003647B515